MNEPSQEVAATLEWLRTTAQDGIDKAGPFLSEQTPLYVEELIRWQIALGWALPVMFLVWVSFWIWFASIMDNASKADDDDVDGYKALTGFAVGCILVGGIVLFIASAVNGYFAFQAWLAPRVFIANHFTDMLQGCGG